MVTPGHEDWLLVLDNFDDIRVRLDHFLPVGASGSVLITTRDRNAIGSVATSGVPLTAMDPLDAERLFLRIQSLGTEPNLQISTSGPERQDLKQILGELQCFPLAIDQAASFIRENSPMTLREYLTYLKPRSIDRERLLRFKQANPTYPDSVMTTWEISIQYLERTQPRAGWILQLLGFLDHSHISEELLTAVTKRIPWLFDATLVGKNLPFKHQTQMTFLEDDVGFRVAIGTLVSLSLIQRHLSGPTLHVHPLVHEWIRVRLNPYPEQQAKFTIAAALILYQYLPSEMVIWLDYHPTFISKQVSHRINQVFHHFKGVLVNLDDYAIHATNIPLECFMLCGVCLLARFSKQSTHSFDISTGLLEDMDRITNLVIRCLPHDRMPLAYFIHRVILWLRGNEKQRSRLTPVSKMADTFESLQFEISPEEYPDDFLMLLASSVVDVCDNLNHIYTEKLSYGGDQYHEKFPDEQNQRRHIRYRLLERLRSLFSSIGTLSTLLRKTDMVIKNRLLRVMTPEEFATQKWFGIKQKLSTEDLGPLTFDEEAAYLCLVAKLLWEYQGPRDFLSLQTIFSTVISECSSMRMKARRSKLLQRDRAGIHALSRSSYISSSFGRDIVSTSEKKIDIDLITPLNYIWAITLLVAQAMSDPRQASRIDGTHIALLNLSQRRWSLELVSSVSKIYKRIRSDQGNDMGIDARFLSHFADLSVRYCLMNIYANLEEWEKVQRELVILLQCRGVLRFCETLETLPWENQSEFSVQGNVSLPTPLPTPQHEVHETFWPLLVTKLYKTARELVTGQVSGVSGPSSEPSIATGLQNPVVKMQNTAAEIEDRLETAAYQRQSGQPEHLWNKVSRLERLGIPDSCNCITDPNVSSAIVHFFTLAVRKEILKEAEANELRLKIRVVARMSPKSFAKYLGNLELIYQLAQKFSAKFPESMDVGNALDDKLFADESDTGSSDDELREEADDTVESDNIAGMEQFDWGW